MLYDMDIRYPSVFGLLCYPSILRLDCQLCSALCLWWKLRYFLLNSNNIIFQWNREKAEDWFPLQIFCQVSLNYYLTFNILTMINLLSSDPFRSVYVFTLYQILEIWNSNSWKGLRTWASYKINFPSKVTFVRGEKIIIWKTKNHYWN